MKIVLTLGMSRPDSMIVVATRMSNSRRMKREHRPLELPRRPSGRGAIAIRASGTIDWIRSAIALDVVDAVVDEVDLAVAVQLAVDGPLDRLVVEPE